MKTYPRSRSLVAVYALAAIVAAGEAGCGGDEFDVLDPPNIYRCECMTTVDDLPYNFHEYACAYDITAQAQCKDKCAHEGGAMQIYVDENIACSDEMADAWNASGGSGGAGGDDADGASSAGAGAEGGDGAEENAPPDGGGASEVEIDHDLSQLVIDAGGDQVIARASGIVEFSGGCDAGSCDLEVSYAAVAVDAFDIQVGGGTQVSEVNVASITKLKVSQTDGYFTIPGDQIKILAEGRLNGSRKGTIFALPSDQDILGYYEPHSGSFQLVGKLSSSEGSVTLDLAGFATARRPVADAGPRQNVTAGSNGRAVVTLDGRGSYDLDDDLTQVRWYEGATYLGAGSTLQLSLGVGAHDVTARAVDATTRWNDAHVSLTVRPH